MTIIESWHNLTSLAELNKAVEQLNEWAAANKVAPDTIHIQGYSLCIRLVDETLSDKSIVYNLAIG